MTFETKYTEQDFLTAINDGFKTTGYVAKTVGCARRTAETYLKDLQDSGKIKRIAIDDGLVYVWICR
jgi:predicted HTH transcriptional regulator